jgi:putative nucleotidyltransferase with HDIG domain
MVRRLGGAVGARLGLGRSAGTELDYAARLRDVGMLALPDVVVDADGPLSDEQWELVCAHPAAGAELLAEVPELGLCVEGVRWHHERWDGGGYPDGLRGDEIPVAARVIAACDVFAAIASDRPYRPALGGEAALEQVARASDSQLDPGVVDAMLATFGKSVRHRAVAGGASRRAGSPDRDATPTPRRRRQTVPAERLDVAAAVKEFEQLPVLAAAQERLHAALGDPVSTGGDLVAAVESDVGLVVAVLRSAQVMAGRREITNVPDAIALLGSVGVREAVAGLPLSDFPSRSSPQALFAQSVRAHSAAVARAADRLSRETTLGDRDVVLVAAQLHDLGKLVLNRARSDYPSEIHAGARTPEERVRQELRALGIDHTTVGALLVRRWRLSDRLARIVAEHHSDDRRSEAALVRLGDMLVRHAQGEVIDGATMRRLSYACGLEPRKLHVILLDLPHAGGSQRRRSQRRSERSPLSARETQILGLLAEGKVYGAIALETGVSTSTVRTHLHNVYRKLGVPDRAQAVLRAAEKGWL